MSKIEIIFCNISVFDIFSFRILGRKYEKNNVIKKRKIYWRPRKALSMDKKANGTNDMEKLCKIVAVPPDT